MSWQTILGSAVAVTFLEGMFKLVQYLLDRRAAKKDGKARSLSARIDGIENRVREIAESNQAEIAGLRSLLCIEIKTKAKAAIAAGFITSEDLEDLMCEHDLYHGPLEGNGFLKALMAKVNSLPVRD